MTSQNARTGAIRNYDNSWAPNSKGPSINYVVLVRRGVASRTNYYIDLT